MQAEIGIIGGTDLYEFTKSSLLGEFFVNTPFGAPSDKISIFEHCGKNISFLPRHGKQHQFPPHKINYKANLFALKKIGVEKIIATGAVGSLKSNIQPGDFIFCDQFINFTKREDTFFNGKKECPVQLPKFIKVAHISSAYPFCETLRKLAIKKAEKLDLVSHIQGTAVIIEGPRFSTKAESRYFTNFADVVNMTQYPEVVLAKELSMCYLNISLATDYDAGLMDSPGILPVNSQEVAKIFKKNNEKMKVLILEIIKNIPTNSYCSCQNSLDNAWIA